MHFLLFVGKQGETYVGQFYFDILSSTVASACWGYCMKPDNKMDNDKMNLAWDKWKLLGRMLPYMRYSCFREKDWQLDQPCLFTEEVTYDFAMINVLNLEQYLNTCKRNVDFNF